MDALDKAVSVFGTQSALAAQINVGQSHIAMWKKRGRVPADHCPDIERATRAAGFPVLCEELRPDVAWDVLRATVA